jgi:hypothetical protein
MRFVAGSHHSVKSVFRAARPLREFLAKAAETEEAKAVLVDRTIDIFARFMAGMRQHSRTRRQSRSADVRHQILR